VIELDPDDGDSLKRLAVTERNDLQQHSTLSIDLQPIAVSARSQLVKPKQPRTATDIDSAWHGLGRHSVSPGHTATTNDGEPQYPEQGRRVQHEQELLPDTAAYMRILLIADGAAPLIPGPPQLPVAHPVRTVLPTPSCSSRTRSSARQIRKTSSLSAGPLDLSDAPYVEIDAPRRLSSSMPARQAAEARSSCRQMRYVASTDRNGVSAR
jgi:hypothetical protein